MGVPPSSHPFTDGFSIKTIHLSILGVAENSREPRHDLFSHRRFGAPRGAGSAADVWPQVYTVQQWSWPLDLPSAFYGIFATELKVPDIARWDQSHSWEFAEWM
jgi:hypothetical protein